MTTILLELDGFRAASSQLRHAHSRSRKIQNNNAFRLIRLERQDGRLGGLCIQGGCWYFLRGTADGCAELVAEVPSDVH